MKGLRLLVGLVFCLTLVVSAEQPKLPKPAFPMTAEIHPDGQPVLRWREPSDLKELKGRVMLRSTTDLRTTKNALDFPIVGLDANPFLDSYRDWKAPHDVPLYYQLRLDLSNGQKVYSDVVTVKLAAPVIPPLKNPMLAVDKNAYTLSVLDSKGSVMRRFPIALGYDPKGRKLHYDRARTPEGNYRICGVQPRATYYKAFDLDYPNDVDRTRHRIALETNPSLPAIGGEIQIHGDGIESNWTAGCIAMRNSDMDLLFGLPGLTHGTTVAVSGSELKESDLLSDLFLTPELKASYTDHLIAQGFSRERTHKDWIVGLCRLQAKHGLKVTGLFDQNTRRFFSRDLAKKPKPKAIR